MAGHKFDELNICTINCSFYFLWQTCKTRWLHLMWIKEVTQKQLGLYSPIKTNNIPPQWSLALFLRPLLCIFTSTLLDQNKICSQFLIKLNPFNNKNLHSPLKECASFCNNVLPICSAHLRMSFLWMVSILILRYFCRVHY